MIVTPTEIADVFEVTPQPHYDERGFFARLFCPEALASAGLKFASIQINLSRNIQAYTLRGMHFQAAPFAEAKIVRVTRGAIFDVVVDLRDDSPTRYHWIGRNLDAQGSNALLIPEGCAHGFLTLKPDTDVLYQMSRAYVAGHSQGFRFDDPRIGIVWPHTPTTISTTDSAWPPL